jgi:phosphatidylserine decarboxylase
MLLITVVCGGLAAVSFCLAAGGAVWAWFVGGVFVLLWAAGLAFFRDPERAVPADGDAMVSPADGVVTEVAELEHHADVDGPARRISIFLSVLNVHINRAPCDGVVRMMRYKPGKFLDARDVNSGVLNESNTVVIEPDDPNEGPVVVRQIAGLIARRIVCNLKVGDRVKRGQRIGLIKFGSRTEWVVPAKSPFQPAVRVGDKVRGTLTIIARRQQGGAGQANHTAASKARAD